MSRAAATSPLGPFFCPWSRFSPRLMQGLPSRQNAPVSQILTLAALSDTDPNCLAMMGLCRATGRFLTVMARSEPFTFDAPEPTVHS